MKYLGFPIMDLIDTLRLEVNTIFYIHLQRPIKEEPTTNLNIKSVEVMTIALRK